MRRLAAHYICWKKLFRLHYLEMEEDVLIAVRPLNQEEAGIEFYNGLLFPLPAAAGFDHEQMYIVQQDYKTAFLPELILHAGITRTLQPGDKVTLWHAPVLHLPASELSTDHSRSNRYIQRL